jgi:hypothetical protein
MENRGKICEKRNEENYNMFQFLYNFYFDIMLFDIKIQIRFFYDNFMLMIFNEMQINHKLLFISFNGIR